jgi:hypothetical protein
MADYIPSVRSIARLAALVVVGLTPAMAGAQVPTGTLSGRVTDGQDRPVGAVQVTVSSPALQGVQATTTTVNGDYVFRLLPPGEYSITFEASGFAPQRVARSIAATAAVPLNITLEPAAVTEQVTVAADTPLFVASFGSATSFSQQLIDLLPGNRAIETTTALAPAVTTTGPSGAFTIAGAMSFDNLFLVNGVQIQDNIRGEPLPLYIEDAIQETTVSTSGISAEYGRFAGGVVNVLTRSGGNLFTGSFRTSFRNDNWRSVTPFDEPKVDSLIQTHEYTFGGPINRDRTWFFLAGRLEDSEQSRETGYTRIPFVAGQDEKRFEFKATQALAAGHRLQAAYTAIQREQTNSAQPSPAGVMDLASLTNPQTPESLLALHYTANLRSNFSFEAQYSARNFTFRNAGSSSRDRIFGTPLLDQTTGAFFWSPLYCGVCRDEERDNSSILFKGSYFLSTASTGAHNVVFGYDGFNDRMVSDNFQSGSDWHVWATRSAIDGNDVYPVIEPGLSTYIIHWPVRESTLGTNFRTHSLFVNDTWSFDRHWSFNLGLRYDRNDGRDGSGNLVADDSLIAPRLGAIWDPAGDGRRTFNAAYGRYAAGLNNSVAGSAAAAGNPAVLGYYYFGDPINADGPPYVTSDEALRRVFEWFDASEGQSLFFADIPGLATRIDQSLKTPFADELVVGISQLIGTRGAVRLDVVNREFGNFYVTRTDLTTGQASDEFGQLYDVGLIENSNELSRRYRALNAQASYRVGADLNVGLSYTLSRLWGDFDGETTGSGPITSSDFAYPEFSEASWTRPVGDLSADQRHRTRVWGTWVLPWAREHANMVLGFVQVLESGTPYGAVGVVDVGSFVAVPGYALPPATSTYYFTERDAFRTDGHRRTDLSFQVSRRFGAGRAPELFASFQLRNLFNQFQLFNISGNEINTTVLTNVDDPSLSGFDPFTEAPVEGVHWRRGDQFGQPISRFAYTEPRMFRFSIGIRF